MNKELKKLISLLRVDDSISYQSDFTVGNLNSTINSILKVCPELSSDQFYEILTGLADAGMEDGDELSLYFDREPSVLSVYTYRIGNMYLNFIKL